MPKLILIICSIYGMLACLSHQTWSAELVEYNKLHLEMYSYARDLDLLNVTYIITNTHRLQLFMGNELIDQTDEIIKNSRYELLKEISHILLAITSQFGSRCNQAFTKKQEDYFRLLVTKMNSMYDTVQNASLLTSQMKSRNFLFFNYTIDFVNEMLMEGVLNCTKYTSYGDRTRDIIMQNVFDATYYLLQEVHKIINVWKEKYTSFNWSRIFVVICGPHMARDQEVLVQYFQKLLNTTFEGDHVVFAETFNIQECKLMLQTHITDSLLSEKFFKDRMRMHRDLLSDAAKQIIPTIFKDKPELNIISSSTKLNFGSNFFVLMLIFMILFQKFIDQI